MQATLVGINVHLSAPGRPNPVHLHRAKSGSHQLAMQSCDAQWPACRCRPSSRCTWTSSRRGTTCWMRRWRRRTYPSCSTGSPQPAQPANALWVRPRICHHLQSPCAALRCITPISNPRHADQACQCSRCHILCHRQHHIAFLRPASKIASCLACQCKRHHRPQRSAA